MRAHGLHVYGTCRQEILFHTLRRCEEHDDTGLPLRSFRLRREGKGGVTGSQLTAVGPVAWVGLAMPPMRPAPSPLSVARSAGCVPADGCVAMALGGLWKDVAKG